MPKIDGPEGFAKGLSVDTLPKGDSVAGFPKGDSPAAVAKGDSVAGLDAAKLENPPAFANEPNPPPAAALGVPKGSGLPGVDGCPKLGAALAPKPDWPNWGVARPRALGVPNEGLIWDGDPNDGPLGADGVPKAGCRLPRAEGLPNAGTAEGLPNGDDPIAEGLPKADCPNAGCPNAGRVVGCACSAACDCRCGCGVGGCGLTETRPW